MKIGVIGAGKWGEALFFALSQNPKNEVYITSRKQRDLPNFITIDEIMEFEYLLIAISAHILESGWMRILSLKIKKFW